MYFVHYCLWDYWVEISWSKWLITNIKQIEEVYPSPHVVPSPFVVAPLPSLSLGLTTCLSILKIVFVTSKNFFSDLSQKGLEFECCSGHSPSRFCFSHIVHGQNTTHSCLPARVTVVAKSECYSNTDCRNLSERICVKPMTSGVNKLVKISHTQGQDVLFVGNPYELLVHVSVSDYFPNWNFIPMDIPDYIQTFLVYFASLSGALAILNMIPCYCLDGQWALMAFIEHFLARIITNGSIRAIIYHAVLFTSTVLLLVNIIFAFWNLRGQGVLSLISQQVKPA